MKKVQLKINTDYISQLFCISGHIPLYLIYVTQDMYMYAYTQVDNLTLITFHIFFEHTVFHQKRIVP